jgi:hypothetical protein
VKGKFHAQRNRFAARFPGPFSLLICGPICGLICAAYASALIIMRGFRIRVIDLLAITRPGRRRSFVRYTHPRVH